jgi:hypothetical protein
MTHLKLEFELWTLKTFLFWVVTSQNMSCAVRYVSLVDQDTIDYVSTAILAKKEFKKHKRYVTGKSVSEALILESVNPQYDDRLFIDLRLQYKKNTSSEHVVNKNCFLFLFSHSIQFLYTTCSELVFFTYWTHNSMNNLLSYCGLTDTRMCASEKYLRVPMQLYGHFF